MPSLRSHPIPGVALPPLMLSRLPKCSFASEIKMLFSTSLLEVSILSRPTVVPDTPSCSQAPDGRRRAVPKGSERVAQEAGRLALQEVYVCRLLGRWPHISRLAVGRPQLWGGAALPGITWGSHCLSNHWPDIPNRFYTSFPPPW